MSKQYTRVEDILGIYNDRGWYYIPGFNGYEVSNDGYIRSMKHYRRYPFGILISPVSREPYGSSSDPLYELSDDNNIRQRIRLSQIMQLAAKTQLQPAGYPRLTIVTDSQSRNKYVKNASGAYVKVYNGPNAGGGKNSFSIPPMDNTAHYAKFTIIQDGKEMPNMEYNLNRVKCPVSSINGDEYYGRKDCNVYLDYDIRSGY